MIKMAAVKLTKHFERPQKAGTYHRLVCLNGHNKGQAYLFTNNRVVLGRSEKADIRVLDIKSSREHAEIVIVGTNPVLTDLKSQNGIVVNDNKVKQERLHHGDKIVIGQTIYKYEKLEVKDKSLINNDEEDEDESFDVDFQNENESKPKNKKVTYLLFGLILVSVFLLLDEESAPEKSGKIKRKRDEVVIEHNNRQSKKISPQEIELKKQINMIIKRGLREFREENFFRALAEFEHALTIDPNDALADFYLRRTQEALDKKIDMHFIKSRRDEESLKYQSAIVSYCSIIRLLYKYQEDERYLNAKKGIENMENKLGREIGETNCLQE
jgi:pSer/pThr/pTyr-binding forkhead associated (FHA) protein